MPLCVEHNFKRLIAVGTLVVLEMHPVSANVTAIFQGSLEILNCAEWEGDLSCIILQQLGKKKKFKKERKFDDP